jgi:hypothetical protein
LAQIANIFGGAAGPELAGGYSPAWREQGAGGEHGPAFDLAAVHDDGAEADESAVVEDATMDHRHMADQNVLADDRRQALASRPRRIDVDDSAVLKVGAGADADPVDVAAKHAIVPDARLRADLDVADQPGAGRDEGGGIDQRRVAAERNETRAGDHDGRSAT